MPKVLIPKVEFYITNVCNLTCDHCNRFNNYKFKGWQKWADVKDVYTQWGKLININHRVILGGEPLLNPDIVSWCKGVKSIWCNDFGSTEIITNGYRLNHVPGLYDLVKSRIAYLRVTLHNSNEKNFIVNEIKSFLQGPITIEERSASVWFFIDQNKIRVELALEDQFSESAIIQNSSGKLTLHQSDPVKAHDICCMAHNDTVHFIHGKIYKCGPAALFEEFDQQHQFDISDEDRILLST